MLIFQTILLNNLYIFEVGHHFNLNRSHVFLVMYVRNVTILIC